MISALRVCTTKYDWAKADCLLFRVSVLGNQIAGVARQHQIIHLAWAPGSKVYHFVDLNKMVQNLES